MRVRQVGRGERAEQAGGARGGRRRAGQEAQPDEAELPARAEAGRGRLGDDLAVVRPRRLGVALRRRQVAQAARAR